MIFVARIKGGVDRADTRNPIALANVVGEPNKSTDREMLTNRVWPDGPTFNMNIWPIIDSPAA